MGLPVEEMMERVDLALGVMGLKHLSEKPCYLLSGGEKGVLPLPVCLR